MPVDQITKQISSLVEQMYKEHHVQILEVHVKWLDVGTYGEPNHVRTSIEIEAKL